jgi:hypothetical protein
VVLLLIGDGFFWLFHTVLIFFNLFGWMSPRFRKWNLIALGATLFSWLAMGLFYGIGYCICTDWHFQIRRELGITERADTYLQLLVRKISGWDPPIHLVNNVAAVCMTIAVVASVSLNIRDWRRRRATKP